MKHGAAVGEARMVSCRTAPSLDAVRTYLNTNGALRETLGVPSGVSIEPEPLGAGEHNLNASFRVPARDGRADAGRAALARTGAGDPAERYVLRINLVPQPFHENQVAYEFAALTALEPSGCTPRPYYLDRSSDSFPHGALVTGFCQGRELDFDALRPGDLETAVRLMARVHAVPVSAGCPIHRPADPAQELFDECMERFRFYMASGYAQPRITEWAQRFIARAEEALGATGSPGAERCAVNTETLASHFLLCADAEADSGTLGHARPLENADGWFLDWERPILGEAAQDVAYFVAPTTTFWDSERLFTRTEARAIVDSYLEAASGRVPLQGFDERFETYLALTFLRSITWCCRAHARLSAGTLTHMTPKTRGKLSTYLSDRFLETVYTW